MDEGRKLWIDIFFFLMQKISLLNFIYRFDFVTYYGADFIVLRLNLSLKDFSRVSELSIGF